MFNIQNPFDCLTYITIFIHSLIELCFFFQPAITIIQIFRTHLSWLCILVMILWDVLQTLFIFLKLLFFLSHLNIEHTLLSTIITVHTLLFDATLLMLLIFMWNTGILLFFFAGDILWQLAQIKRRYYVLNVFDSVSGSLEIKSRFNQFIAVFRVETVFIVTIRFTRFKTSLKSAYELVETRCWNLFEAVVVIKLVDRDVSVFL
jgi:hypothetical protein